MSGEANESLKKLICAGIVGLVPGGRRIVMVTKKLSLIVIVALLALVTLTEAANEPVGTWEIGTRYLDGTAFEPGTDMLDIGDSLYLSIYTEEAFGWGSTFGYYWALVCDPSLAVITGGEAGPDADTYVAFWGSPADAGFYGVPGDGQWGKIWPDEVGCYFEPGLYMDYFLYSPEYVGDVTVSFWHLTYDPWGGPPYGVVDSIVINQVPEPMTITLVCIGALLLRRRRAGDG